MYAENGSLRLRRDTQHSIHVSNMSESEIMFAATERPAFQHYKMFRICKSHPNNTSVFFRFVTLKKTDHNTQSSETSYIALLRKSRM